MRNDRGTRDAGAAALVAGEVDEELALHLDLLREELRAAGLRGEALEAHVRVRFGDPEAIRRACIRNRTPGGTMFERIHRFTTLFLALAVVALLGLHASARAQAAREIAGLRATMEGLVERLGRDATGDVRSALAEPGDVVEITDDFQNVGGRYVVDESGALVLPTIGRVGVAGQTPEEIRAELQALAEQFFVAVDLSIGLYPPDRDEPD